MTVNRFPAYAKGKDYPDIKQSAFRTKTKANLDVFVKTTAHDLIHLISNTKRTVGKPAYGLPKNPVSGHQYLQTNMVLLTMAMMGNGWEDARFCSSEQAKTVGENTQVLKEDNSITVLRPIIVDRNPEIGGKVDSINDNNDPIVFFQPYKLFHASQIENMPAPEKTFDTINWETNNAVERLVEASGIKLQHGSTSAQYSHHRDTIHMPDKETFETAGDYASTLLHQWYHATGHKDRENRIGQGPSAMAAGLLENGLEEIRAETFSVLAGKALGLPSSMSTRAEYVRVWEKQCKDNPQQVLTQACSAAEMLNTVMHFVQGEQPDAKWFPEKASWSTMTDSDQAWDLVREAAMQETNGFNKIHDDNSTIILSPSKDGTSNDPLEIQEAYRIKQSLENKFGEGVKIQIDMNDDTILLKIEQGSALVLNNEEDNTLSM
jgi:antirestriction protein ArdC